MKITIVDLLPGEEEETIIKCNSVTPKLLELINELKSQNEEEVVRNYEIPYGLRIWPIQRRNNLRNLR